MKQDQKQDQKQQEFMSLVMKHQGIIHKICFIYGHKPVDRDDLYQEILLQLWRSWPTFRQNAAFSTWMYRVALNTAINQTRKPSLFLREDPPAEQAENPGILADLSEEIRLLYCAIARLGKVDRAIILLWLEEKSYEEIAGITGITAKNVSVKLVRIKARLAEQISKMY